MSSLLDEEVAGLAEQEAISQSSRKPLGRTAVANVALRGTSMAARFLLMIGLAHYLSPDDVGVFGLMYASTTLGTLFLGMRFDVYSTRAICSADRSSPAAVIRDQMVFHLLVYVIALPLMLLLFALRVLPWQLLAWFYLLLVLEHSGQECMRLFVALSQPLRANFVFFLRSGLWALALIALMLASPAYRNLETLWVAWAIGGVASLVMSGLWMRSLGWRSAIRERVDWDWIRRGLKPSLAFSVAIGASTLITTLDRFFIRRFWGGAHVGVYAFYWNLTNFITTFADTGIISILLPSLLAAAASGDSEAYSSILRRMSKGV